MSPLRTRTATTGVGPPPRLPPPSPFSPFCPLPPPCFLYAPPAGGLPPPGGSASPPRVPMRKNPAPAGRRPAIHIRIARGCWASSGRDVGSKLHDEGHVQIRTPRRT